ncbi:efflux RND transporter periplasmic adaptor subunit [Pleurocapsa sp. PCC 7319]|uniref:efflux RND transporter periplasmic adaptor subunit n=1 Tax=Pleurocapsa sp. PCC 7319 TaxID=118161 RepID=UPI00034578D8|nr:efflux RND transporter periplasmic adaptor subunit [Pleurocapsa sp. PCC 7319]
MIYTQQSQFATPLVRISASVVAVTMLLGIGGCGGEKEQASQPQAVAVKLKTIESATLIDSSEYVGTLEARERVSLAPRTEGRILEIFARQGDRVSRGDPIVKLEPTQEQENVNAATQSVNVEKARLGQNQAELRTAEANQAAAAAEVESAKADVQDAAAAVELAKINIERTRMLVEGGALAQQDLDDDNRDLKSGIAQLNSRRETLNAATKSLEAAEKQVEQARANIDSQNATIKQVEAELGSISQNLAFNTINAPIDGVLGSFDDKKVGDYVDIGEELTTITNNQSFDLNVNIPVEYRDRLKPGLTVEIVNEDGSPGTKGEIAYIAPLVQQNTQSILTKVTFPNQGSLKDREYVRVRVIWGKKPGVLVPTNAISTLGGQNFVYLATEANSQEESSTQSSNESNLPEENNSQSPNASLIAQQQPIKLGSIQAQNYQVLSGLQEGDRIAVSNILSLRDGTPIQLVESEQAVSEVSNESRQAGSR